MKMDVCHIHVFTFPISAEIHVSPVQANDQQTHIDYGDRT